LTKKQKTEEEKLYEKVKDLLPTHIVEIELKSDSSQTKEILNSMEHARLIRNTALGKMENNYNQMVRTKAYKGLLKKYGKISETLSKEKDEKQVKILEKEKNNIQKKLQDMQVKFNVTKKQAEDLTKKLQKHFSKAQAVIAQTIANGVWDSIEGLLYRDAKHPKYKDKQRFRSIEGKQNERCIMLKKDEKERFFLSYLKMNLPLIVKKDDLFIQETLSNIAYYMDNFKSINKENIERVERGNSPKSTYRVKYNRIIKKEIRGKIRLFLQVVLEGVPVPRRKKDGSFRHKEGTGVVAADIGTQSLAVTTEHEVVLKNLAERTTTSRERELVLLQRKLDRSRRATNPDCFDKKGRAIKKMHTKSKRYLKTQKKLRNLHRVLTENKKYAHREDINILRSLGDVFITEPSNYKALQKRAKEVTINEKTGKFNCRKRYGKSILNRSPGYFIQQLKYRFELSGGTFKEVNGWTFKASQFDHMSGVNNKKQLSQRWHIFEDGTKVQRDLYSSFLMYCSNDKGTKPDIISCNENFNHFKLLHNYCVDEMKFHNKEVKNSGIKMTKGKKKNLIFQEKKKNTFYKQFKKYVMFVLCYEKFFSTKALVLN